MILGESHYCEKGCTDCGNARVYPECCAFTNSVVSDYKNEALDRHRWMSTYLKFERSLVGHETDWAERKKIWNSVVFYNYLQAAMDGPRGPVQISSMKRQQSRSSRCWSSTARSMSSCGVLVFGATCQQGNAGRGMRTSLWMVTSTNVATMP